MNVVRGDRRGRVNLGVHVQADRYYRAKTGFDRVVVLEPVTLITDYEMTVLTNPSLKAGIKRGLAQIANGQVAARCRESR